MTFSPRVPQGALRLRAIESHTMGEPTRIIYDGFPTLHGATMMEKKNDLLTRFDHLRTALMLEPRGHRDMFGALLTEPCDSRADLGVIFLESGGCLNMCGHGSIGVCAMAVETGLVPAREGETAVTLDTPAGLVRGVVRVENGHAVSVSIRNVPAFLAQRGRTVTLRDRRSITLDISFGGSFFALVDADALGLPLVRENAAALSTLGMDILEAVNRDAPRHPTLDIHSVDLVEFYSARAGEGAHARSCVVFGDAQIDRSPCGTGTSAKLAALHAHGALGLNEPFVYESITLSRFVGEIVGETRVGDCPAVETRITGNAWLTGLSDWVVMPDDPLGHGFLLG